jgi:hypothetical protein
MTHTVKYWSRNRDLDEVVKRRGLPMERVEMLHQCDLAKYELNADGSRTGRYSINAEQMWPHAQRLSGQGGITIVNLEWDAGHAARFNDGLIYYDPRRSTPAQIEKTVGIVNDVMLPMEICAPAMLRTVTLSCNLPYFRTGRDGEAGWRRSVDRLVDMGMFARQTAHFIDCWSDDSNPQGDWMISKSGIAGDEGQFDQSVRLARHLPELPIIMQWAPATRNGVPMRPGILARNVAHNLRVAPHVIPFIWISGVRAFDGGTNADGSPKIVDWAQGTPEGDYLVRELERIFANRSQIVVGVVAEEAKA